jgi:dUTP pyrophosphatase
MKIKLLSDKAKVPTKANVGDAGFDLYSPIDFVIPSGEQKLIKIGIQITDFPPGTYGRIAPRSGLGFKGVQVMAGVIDATYQGEVGVILYVNPSAQPLNISEGDRIAQLVIERYEPNVLFEVVENFVQVTERGSGGFGSSGN